MGKRFKKDAEGRFGPVESHLKVIAREMTEGFRGGHIAVNGKIMVVFLKVNYYAPSLRWIDRHKMHSYKLQFHNNSMYLLFCLLYTSDAADE